MKKILIIGDTIIDQNYYLNSPDISLESPTIKANLNYFNEKFGGAALVATSLKKIDSKNEIFFLSSMSAKYKKIIEQKYKIKVLNFFSGKDNLKKRFWISRGNESYNYLQVRDLNDKLIKVNLNINYKEFDIIAFSDYQCGLITSNLVNKVLLKKKKNTFSSFQISSNSSNVWRKFISTEYIICNENESKFIKKRKKNICITLGANGSYFNGKHYKTRKCKAKNTIGAGDIFYASFILKKNPSFSNLQAYKYISKEF